MLAACYYVMTRHSFHVILDITAVRSDHGNLDVMSPKVHSDFLWLFTCISVSSHTYHVLSLLWVCLSHLTNCDHWREYVTSGNHGKLVGCQW